MAARNAIVGAAARRRLAPALLALGLVVAGCGGDDGGPEPPVAPSLTNVLRIGPAGGDRGGTASIDLLLKSTVALGGLQFDLAFDRDVLTVTGAAPGPRAAGFDAAFHVTAGVARVVLIDLDGDASIAPGDGVVATVSVAIAAGAPAGPTPLRVDNATGVNRAATTVPIGSSSASFTVR